MPTKIKATERPSQRTTLPPDQLRQMREDLGLSRIELAELLETTKWMVQRWERPADRESHVKPPHRVVRLLEAYKAGYRPLDWPAAEER